MRVGNVPPPGYGKEKYDDDATSLLGDSYTAEELLAIASLPLNNWFIEMAEAQEEEEEENLY